MRVSHGAMGRVGGLAAFRKAARRSAAERRAVGSKVKAARARLSNVHMAYFRGLVNRRKQRTRG